MPWDLQISNFNDLVFSPNRDFTVITGEALMAQRIMLRIRMKRGSWILDDTRTLGSNVDFALNMGQERAMEEMEGLVAEALEPMGEEIQLDEVICTPNADDIRAVDLFVKYIPILPEIRSQLPMTEAPSLRMTIPLVT